MQVTITKIVDKERVSQRTGKPFTSRSIQTNEYGDKWLSGFAGKDNADWRVGDTVEVEVETKGEYLNFSVPKGSFSKTPGAPDVNRVEAKVDALRADLATIGATLTAMKGVMGDILSKVDPAVDQFDVPFGQ